MRIACVDDSAASRVSLQRLLEQAYVDCRSSLGHVSAVNPYPVSKEELVSSSAPDIIVVGSSFDVDSAYAVCRKCHDVFENVPLVVVLSPENFSLRTLGRFEHLSKQIISLSDDSTRIVHALNSVRSSLRPKKDGKLVCVSGVKGGVGTTTFVSALAHGFQAQGQDAIVVDLSPGAVFSIYMGSQKTISLDYASALTDGVFPDEETVDRCIVKAPNDVSVLLSPAGGTDIRELWLRDPSRVEISFHFIEKLCEKFDVVIVDTARTEGLFPFALLCRSDHRLLVSSNEAASVHLLNSELNRLLDSPGHGRVGVLYNRISDSGLSSRDLLNFLSTNPKFGTSDVAIVSLPFDGKGRNWIGSGNTFYTEGKRATQKILDRICEQILSGGIDQTTFVSRLRSVGSMGRALSSKLFRSRDGEEPKLLPFLGDENALSKRRAVSQSFLPKRKSRRSELSSAVTKSPVDPSSLEQKLEKHLAKVGPLTAEPSGGSRSLVNGQGSSIYQPPVLKKRKEKEGTHHVF